MNLPTLATLVAFGGIFAFGRDLIAVFRNRHKRVSEEESQAAKQPFEINSMAMANAKEALTVQSALLLEFKARTQEEHDRALAAEARADELGAQLESAKQELRNEIIRNHQKGT